VAVLAAACESVVAPTGQGQRARRASRGDPCAVTGYITNDIFGDVVAAGSEESQRLHKTAGRIGEASLTAPSYNRMVVPMQAIFDHDRIFAALADATRRDIVRRAMDAEEGVAELADHYPMSFAGVQKHIAILERAGLVTKRRIGRRKVVRTNVEAIRMAQRLLDRYEELWRDRVDRMTELISADHTEETTG
jgi:DNA-binding transcriptional ArsR family regulator